MVLVSVFWNILFLLGLIIVPPFALTCVFPQDIQVLFFFNLPDCDPFAAKGIVNPDADACVCECLCVRTAQTIHF